MARPFGHRSSSGGSFLELSHYPHGRVSSYKAIGTGEADAAAQELFRILLQLKDRHGRSFLHSLQPLSLSMAQELLQRASQLDQPDTATTTTPRAPSSWTRQLLLQPDVESAYTPLHCAILRGQLPMILLLLRHAANYPCSLATTDMPRLTHCPMQLLQGSAGGTVTTTITNVTATTTNVDLVKKMTQSVDQEGFTPLELLGRLQQPILKHCRQSLHNATSITNPQLLPLDDDSMKFGCEVVTFGRADHCALGVVVPTRAEACLSSNRVQAFGLDHVGWQGAAVAIAAAAHHTLVVTRNGHLYAFGLGKGGRLGLGDERHCPLPTRIMGGSLHRQYVVHVAAAENHSLCVTSNGHVYAFGSNRFGQLGVNNNNNTSEPQPKQQHSSAASSGGSTSRCFLPRRVEDLKQVFCIAVAAGDKHSVALTKDGQVYTWGDNQAGQLGGGIRRTSSSLSSSSSSHTGAIQRVDALWNAQPRKVAIAIAASDQSTLVLTSPTGIGLYLNSIYSWGHGNHIPIKVNFTDAKAKCTNAATMGGPTDVQHVINPVGISCAKYHNAAITKDGRVYTWGLHREPLGTGGKSKQQQQRAPNNNNNNSMVIASPQLVTGMLPENGGGVAVAVSTSEHHTAVVTDCGHVYTWGATYGKDVLGHEGVRWQPNPKKVPGVHRAVAVAAAKEHNVMLIGTAIPPFRTQPTSLEMLAARQVAKHVDLFNVIPIMITAHRIECTFLKEYCERFIRLNLDGVLNLGRKSEMDCYLNEQLADTREIENAERDSSHHPLVFDVITAGRTSPSAEVHPEAWMEACADVLKRLPISTRVQQIQNTSTQQQKKPSTAVVRRQRALSFHAETEEVATLSEKHGAKTEIPPGLQSAFQVCSERCLLLTANMNLQTSDGVISKAACLSKEVRSVRKRLSQIAKLLESSNVPASFTAEQAEKIARKSLLEADLAILESAVETVERKMLEWNLQPDTPAALSCVPDASDALIEKTNATKDVPESSESVTSDVNKSFRCHVCSVSCPDANSLTLHQSGRKHRNRVFQVEEDEKKQAAVSIMAAKARQALLSDGNVAQEAPKERTNAWNKGAMSVQPRYTLPPPPHFPALELSLKAVPPSSGKTSSTWSGSLKASAKTVPTVSLDDIVTEDRRMASFKSPPAKASMKATVGKGTSQLSVPIVKLWAAPMAHVPVVNLDSPAATRQASKTTYSLADFINTPPSAPAKMMAAIAPWSEPPSKVVIAAVTPPIALSKSFLEIQQEEQDFRARQHKSCGVEGKWFIERRERAGSISAIQDAEQQEREMQALIEEQMYIEQQIQREQEENKKIIHNRKQAKHGNLSETKSKGKKKQTNQNEAKNNGAKKSKGAKSSNDELADGVSKGCDTSKGLTRRKKRNPASKVPTADSKAMSSTTIATSV